MVPKDQKPRPYAAQAVARIVTLVQEHYRQQLGLTFELADPLMTTAFSDKTAAEAIDWAANVEFIKKTVPEGYINQQNIAVSIIEGSDGDAGGSWNITKT